eukprot:tig00000204_g17744.t1
MGRQLSAALGLALVLIACLSRANAQPTPATVSYTYFSSITYPIDNTYKNTGVGTPDSFYIVVAFDEYITIDSCTAGPPEDGGDCPTLTFTCGESEQTAYAEPTSSSDYIYFKYTVKRAASCSFAGWGSYISLSSIADTAPKATGDYTIDGISLSSYPVELYEQLIIAGAPKLLGARATLDVNTPAASRPENPAPSDYEAAGRPISKFGTVFLVYFSFSEPVQANGAITLNATCGATSRGMDLVDKVVPCASSPTDPCVGSDAGPSLYGRWAGAYTVPPAPADRLSMSSPLAPQGLLFAYKVARGDDCDEYGSGSRSAFRVDLATFSGTVEAVSDQAALSPTLDSSPYLEYPTVVRSVPKVEGLRARLWGSSPVLPKTTVLYDSVGGFRYEAVGPGATLEFFVSYSEAVQIKTNAPPPTLAFTCGEPRTARFAETVQPCSADPTKGCLGSAAGPEYVPDRTYVECGGIVGPTADCSYDDGLARRGLLFRYNVTRKDACDKYSIRPGANVTRGEVVEAVLDRFEAQSAIDQTLWQTATGENKWALFGFAISAPEPQALLTNVFKGDPASVAAAAAASGDPFAFLYAGDYSSVPVALPGDAITFEIKFGEMVEPKAGASPPYFTYTCSDQARGAPKQVATFTGVSVRQELEYSSFTYGYAYTTVYYAQFAATVRRGNACGIGSRGTLAIEGAKLENATGLVASLDDYEVLATLPPPGSVPFLVQADDPSVLRTFFTVKTHPRDFTAAKAASATGAAYVPPKIARTGEVVFLVYVYSERVVVRGPGGWADASSLPAPGTPYLNLTCGGRGGAATPVPAVFAYNETYDATELVGSGLLRVSHVVFAWRVPRDAQCGLTQDAGFPLGPLSNQTAGAGVLQPQAASNSSRGWSLLAALDGAVALDKASIPVDQEFNALYTVFSGQPYVRSWLFFLPTVYGPPSNATGAGRAAASVKDVIYIAVFYDQPVAVQVGAGRRAPFIPVRCGPVVVNATARAIFENRVLGERVSSEPLKVNIRTGTLGPFDLVEGFNTREDYKDPGVLFAFEIPEGAVCGLDPATPTAFNPIDAVAPPVEGAPTAIQDPEALAARGPSIRSRDGVFPARLALKPAPTRLELPFFVFTAPPKIVDVSAAYLGKTIDSSSPAIRIQVTFSRDVTMDPKTPASPPRIDLSSGGIAEFASFDEVRDPRTLNFRYRPMDGEDTDKQPLTVQGPTAFDLRGAVVADQLTGLYADVTVRRTPLRPVLRRAQSWRLRTALELMRASWI